MSKYLRKFETTSAYEEVRQNLVLPNVSYVVETNGVHYEPYIPPRMDIITYSASAKLAETTDTGNTSGLHVNAFSGASGQLTITSHTFENGVGTIKFSDDVTSINNRAFNNCSGLTSITIPNSVTTIGERAFNNCSSLSSIDIPNSVTSIGQYAFGGCSGLTSITIPNSVTSIDIYAFAGCRGLTSIDIPNSVTSIGQYAFGWCSSLTSIDIPNSVTSIGNNAFQDCSGLTSIDIPNSVTSIGTEAFNGCTSLSTITSHIMSAPSVGPGTFYNVNSVGTLYVPIGSTGYDTWMNNQGNLGMYTWTKVEQ